MTAPDVIRRDPSPRGNTFFESFRNVCVRLREASANAGLSIVPAIGSRISSVDSVLSGGVAGVVTAAV